VQWPRRDGVATLLPDGSCSLDIAIVDDEERLRLALRHLAGASSISGRQVPPLNLGSIASRGHDL
jgi:hypothetical protein